MLKKSRIYLNLTLIIVFFFIILAVDFIYTNINKLLYPFNYEDPKSKIYKNFKPNLKEIYISPITGKTLFCTDNNGFRFSGIRRGPKDNNLVFLGDSQTFGVGSDWENTFVGMLESEFEKYNFFNLAVPSYSPTVYEYILNKLAHSKLQHFLNQVRKFTIASKYIKEKHMALDN